MKHDGAAHGTGPNFRGLIRSVVIDIAAPLGLVQILMHGGVPIVRALTLAAVIPFVHTLVAGIRNRRVDLIGVVALAAMLLGIGLALTTGDVVFALAKESIFTALFAVALLGSLLGPRPLLFYFAREASAGGDPQALAAYDGRWNAVPGFRAAMRRITLVWGVAFALEATLRVGAALRLPPPVTVVLSPLLAIVTIGGLIIWTISYARAREREAATASSGIDAKVPRVCGTARLNSEKN